MRQLTASIGLILVCVAPLAALREESEDGFSRPRRSSGMRVVRARPGSLPFDGDWPALADVPVERYHYRWDPRFLDDARRESYVSSSIEEGRLPVAASTAGGIASRAPLRGRTFDGLNRATSGYLGFSAFPPDANLSVSKTKVIQATNVALRMTSRAGVEIDRVPLNNFFGFDSNSLLFDPKVFFDRMSKRFYLVALEQNDSPRRSGIWIAVSRNDSPARLEAPSDFCTYRISGNQGGSWADYPTIGINEEWFAVAVNNFRFSDGSFKKAHVYVMPVDQITSNAQGCPPLGIRRFSPSRDTQGERIFGFHPVQHYSANVGNGSALYMVSTAFFLPSSRYTLWQIASGSGGAPQLSQQNITGDFDYTFAPVAPQRNGLELDSGDPRITQAAFRGGKIWYVHGTACGIGELPNEGCLRAVEVTPRSDAPASITFSETFGLPNTFLFWPGIAINKVGDVLVVSQRAKAGQFLRTVYNGKQAGAPGFDAPRNLGNGNCPLENLSADGSVNRTGDYVGLQTDPLDDLGFWFTGELPGAVGFGFGCDWKTKIARTQYP